MILALVVDAEGRPICTEMVLGNAADVTVLLPVVDRLRTHFSVPRACVAAVFARLPAYPAHRIDDLLPWNRRSAKLRTQPAAA
ncbi:hypothetical protein [Mesorhizobium sp. SARCC-RB16n]|uniref:hypothetical protein n=1 Tax=Mesorhizobium sp. SARCC-RB16n TaxID=2116687 RepID=UPI001AEDB5DD|nr:hypothetical protein [Mesorhizobium sp. SARCC-RB16n]